MQRRLDVYRISGSSCDEIHFQLTVIQPGITKSHIGEIVLQRCIYIFSSFYVISLLGSIFWNISFSVMLPTQREIVEKHIDPSVRNIAHNVADAAYNNFSAIIALSYSDILIDQFGVRMIAFAGILIMLVAVAIETAMLLKKENSKNKAYTGRRIMVSGQEG